MIAYSCNQPENLFKRTIGWPLEDANNYLVPSVPLPFECEAETETVSRCWGYRFGWRSARSAPMLPRGRAEAPSAAVATSCVAAWNPP